MRQSVKSGQNTEQKSINCKIASKIKKGGQKNEGKQRNNRKNGGAVRGAAEVYTGVSAVVATVAAVWAWWKNNSFTAAAVKADEVLKIEKAEGGTEDEGEQ